MASRRVQVLAAVKVLVETALPGVTVKGMDLEEAKPERVGPMGQVIVRSGDPGAAEVDLSPPAYNYDHDIPVELTSGTSGQTTDAMMVAIGLSIVANRTLGGLCTWLDADAPTDGETDAPGAAPISWAEFRIIASYTTTSPLG